MGTAKADVIDGHWKSRPQERELMTPFLTGFDITWATSRQYHRSWLSMYLLKPEKYMTDLFGFEQEVMLLASSYEKLEPRTMQAASTFLNDDPAKGRAEQTVFFLVGEQSDGAEWARSYLSHNPDSRIPVYFSAEELRNATGDSWFIRNQIMHQLFARDLFDDQLPVHDDHFFFGRSGIVASYVDAAKANRNGGLFGLRKTGKTSVLFKVQRQLSREGRVCLYYDCKAPHIRGLSWRQFLEKISADIAQKHGVDARSSDFATQPSYAFHELIHATKANGPTTLIFDEIEYISPLASLDPHWRKDFVPFWQTMWSVQSDLRCLSFIVAGVNPGPTEQDLIDGVQNPMFGIVKPKFIRGLECDEMRQMLRHFGRRMGLDFTSPEVISYLHQHYGGHPLLTRQACSQVHTQVLAQAAVRPFEITPEQLVSGAKDRDAELRFYAKHVVSELEMFYPDEYEFLVSLAQRDLAGLMESSARDSKTKHLIDYGLITFDDVGKPSFAIPVVGEAIASDLAAKQKLELTRRVIPADHRHDWLQTQIEKITANFRRLECIADQSGIERLFGESSYPESEKFHAISVCTDRNTFITTINVCNRCFVESIERFGNKSSKKSYFWNEFKSQYPELFEALFRVKCYRHWVLHLELDNSRIRNGVDGFLKQDLEGKDPSTIEDLYFVLQQAVIAGIVVALRCELNRHS